MGASHRDSGYYRRADDDKEFLRNEFLGKLPKLPSHYCRSTSSKMYLEPIIANKNQLYHLYVEKCNDRDRKPLSRRVLQEECDNMNILVFHPRKDQCDACVSHEAGNMTDEKWASHRADVDEARQEKQNDKQRASTEDEKKTLLLTMDLQAVLLAPRLLASALYYKTKLCVRNFTLYDVVTRDVTCYVWHEGEGGVTTNEFASCVVDYLNEHLQYDTFVIYSDGCTYRNRNAV